VRSPLCQVGIEEFRILRAVIWRRSLKSAPLSFVMYPEMRAVLQLKSPPRIVYVVLVVCKKVSRASSGGSIGSFGEV